MRLFAPTCIRVRDVRATALSMHKRRCINAYIRGILRCSKARWRIRRYGVQQGRRVVKQRDYRRWNRNAGGLLEVVRAQFCRFVKQICTGLYKARSIITPYRSFIRIKCHNLLLSQLFTINCAGNVEISLKNKTATNRRRLARWSRLRQINCPKLSRENGRLGWKEKFLTRSRV